MSAPASAHLRATEFPANARAALHDADLQAALGNVKTGFAARRAESIERVPEFDALRDAARDVKDHVLANLDVYLEMFERNVTETGGHVHWCRTGDDARAAVLEICRSVDAKTVTKGKSMVSEEIELNDFLAGHGIEAVETDLGEYIIQLRGEKPSHIIAPAIHLKSPAVAEAFRRTHTELPANRPLEQNDALLDEARAMLRRRFLAADVGITGANLLIAETGTTVIVTNEGNGDLTQSLPKIHIVIASTEKIVPSLADAAAILRVLARSATGQDISAYTTFSTGPRREGDPDGPEQFHVVLLDGGRTEMLAGEFRDILRCIKCAACMNHCPVYGAVGGHAYGSVYPGPMGAVLSPGLMGLAEAHLLPEASSLCGKCAEVCPVRIPLPDLLRNWRTRSYKAHRSGWLARVALTMWAFWAKRPALYHAGARFKFSAWARIAGRRGALRRVPFLGGWTDTRDLPAPEGGTFITRWKSGERR